MAQPIGSLLVEIGSDVTGLLDGSRKANKALGDIGTNAAKLGVEMAKVGAAVAAAGAAMGAALVKSGLDAIDSQAKLARSLGTTIDSLRGLQIASSDAGIGASELQGALKQLNARLGEAQRGTGEAHASFQRLGLSARDLAAMDADQRMAAIADRMREMGLSTTQAADELRKMGVESEKFVGLMLAGGDAIRSARKEVDEYGLSLSAVDAAKIEQANDAMSRIGRVMEAIRNQITIAFAPLLKELADRFNAVARENRGFADAARDAAEAAIRGFAKVADAVHVLQTTFKGLELVFVNLKAVQITVAEGVIRLWSGVGDVIIGVINTAIRGLQKLGADIQTIASPSESAFVQGLKEMGVEAREAIGQVRMELLDLVTAEWPSTKAEEFLAAVAARAQEAAEQMATATAGIGGGGFTPARESEEDPRAAELERYREMLATKLEALQEFQMTEAELELKRHEERLLALSEALALEMVTVEEARALQESLEEDHMRRMGEIRKKGMSALEKFTSASFANQVKTVAGYMTEMTAGLAQHSKTMFEVNKAAGIANAVISTYQGMAKALELGWPLGPIAAAAIGAQGFAQVAAIKSQSFSGAGGAAPSLAGSTPATPVTPVNGGTGPAGVGGGGGQVLILEGVGEDQLFSGKMIRELVPRIEEFFRDNGGGTIQFARG